MPRNADHIEGHVMLYDPDTDHDYQNNSHDNDIRILTPILLMALIIVGGLIIRGIGTPPVQTAAAPSTTATAQR